MIEGVTVRLGERDYVVPPLNLKAVKQLLPLIEDMSKTGSQLEYLPKVATIVHAALIRNYPEVTMDTIEDILDMGNARTVMNAIMGLSGFVPAGEAKAVSAAADPSTGTTSTAS